MKHWLSGFTSNLSFLFNHTQEDYEKNTGDLVWKEFFEPVALEAIQGASFNGKIFILDEAQLLDMDTLKQAMTRCANGSKLVIILDPKQNYGAFRGNEGYKKLLPHVKDNKLISFVNLQNIYRSELTSLVNDIFKN